MSILMANKPKATISKIRWNHWRGYLDGVQTIEFENTATETAEQAAAGIKRHKFAGKVRAHKSRLKVGTLAARLNRGASPRHQVCFGCRFSGEMNPLYKN
jgi:hypothetical protein